MKRIITIIFLLFSFIIYGQEKKEENGIKYIAAQKSLTELLSQFKGKVVYIDLWGTFCKPCIKEFKKKKELGSYFKDNNIVTLFLCVDQEKSRKKWKPLIEKHKVNGIHTFVEFFTFSKSYKTGLGLKKKELKNLGTIFPHYLIVGKDGTIKESDAFAPSKKKKLVAQLNTYL